MGGKCSHVLFFSQKFMKGRYIVLSRRSSLHLPFLREKVVQASSLIKLLTTFTLWSMMKTLLRSFGRGCLIINMIQVIFFSRMFQLFCALALTNWSIKSGNCAISFSFVLNLESSPVCCIVNHHIEKERKHYSYSYKNRSYKGREVWYLYQSP